MNHNKVIAEINKLLIKKQTSHDKMCEELELKKDNIFEMVRFQTEDQEDYKLRMYIDGPAHDYLSVEGIFTEEFRTALSKKNIEFEHYSSSIIDFYK